MARNRISECLLAIVVLALASGPAIAQGMGKIELAYGMFTTDGMVEQDIFIENPANANEVRRIPISKMASHMNSPLYASAEEPPFQPMVAEPTDPWQGLVFPAGMRDGSQSVFTADAQGNATYDQVVEPCPQLSGTQSLAGLAIAWHSDGETYGASPGGLGVVSHAQLMTIFPHAGGAQ